jgi:hypothetical protein
VGFIANPVRRFSVIFVMAVITVVLLLGILHEFKRK